MIIPKFWAEARVQHRQKGRQITVRRFGWSDVSLDDAQEQANLRAQAALQRLISGEKLPRRERKVAYNGADGMPIREEIVAQSGMTIITRNSYGARCLNTPDVLFADVDLKKRTPCLLYVVAFILTFMIAASSERIIEKFLFRWFNNNKLVVDLNALIIFTSPIVVVFLIAIANSIWIWLRGGLRAIALKTIKRYVESRPDWNARIYETPAGLRVLVTHQLFEPGDKEVLAFFRAIGTDPLYVRMCQNQACFRARLTAKPWRIDMIDYLTPRRAVWPVKPEYLKRRQDWVRCYEAIASRYAACRFLTSFGSGNVHPQVRPVMTLHDDLSQAMLELPIA